MQGLNVNGFCSVTLRLTICVFSQLLKYRVSLFSVNACAGNNMEDGGVCYITLLTFPYFSDFSSVHWS